MTHTLTKHAITRLQQRGMRNSDINMVIKTGTALDGDSIMMLNSDVEREIKNRKKEIAALERLRSVRVVLTEDNTIITAYKARRKTEKKLLRYASIKGH